MARFRILSMLVSAALVAGEARSSILTDMHMLSAPSTTGTGTNTVPGATPTGTPVSRASARSVRARIERDVEAGTTRRAYLELALHAVEHPGKPIDIYDVRIVQDLQKRGAVLKDAIDWLGQIIKPQSAKGDETSEAVGSAPSQQAEEDAIVAGRMADMLLALGALGEDDFRTLFGVVSGEEPFLGKKGTKSAGFSYTYYPWDRFHDEAREVVKHFDEDQSYESGLWVLGGSYAATDSLTVGLTVPLLSRADEPAYAGIGRGTGLGDVAAHLSWSPRPQDEGRLFAGLTATAVMATGDFSEGTGAEEDYFRLDLRSAYKVSGDRIRAHARAGIQGGGDRITTRDLLGGVLVNGARYRTRDGRSGAGWNWAGWADLAFTDFPTQQVALPNDPEDDPGNIPVAGPGGAEDLEDPEGPIVPPFFNYYRDSISSVFDLRVGGALLIAQARCGGRPGVHRHTVHVQWVHRFTDRGLYFSNGVRFGYGFQSAAD